MVSWALYNWHNGYKHHLDVLASGKKDDVAGFFQAMYLFFFNFIFLL